jgi:hypothetical protein
MVAPISSGNGKIITVVIPNREIRTVFSHWIRTDFECRLPPKQRGQSSRLFDNMVRGPMASFAHEFRDLVFNAMPSQFFGSREDVYEAFVKAYLIGAVEADNSAPWWTIEQQRPAGAGHVDLIVQRSGESHSVILELKRISHPKLEGYRADTEAKKLTTETGKAMIQDTIVQCCQLMSQSFRSMAWHLWGRIAQWRDVCLSDRLEGSGSLRTRTLLSRMRRIVQSFTQFLLHKCTTSNEKGAATLKAKAGYFCNSLRIKSG